MNIESWKKHVVPIVSVDKSNIEHTGTAIFLAHKNKQYLLTAKHVVVDADNNEIYPLICKIRSFGESNNGNHKNSIENLQNALKEKRSSFEPFVSETYDYITDLSIISLNNGATREFNEYLLSKGYKPLNIKKIHADRVNEGDEIISIGYPYRISDVGEYHSREVGYLPIVNFGRVAMHHKDLEFMWGDIFTHPGLSGGPIIHKKKLVGVGVGQATLGYSLKHSEENTDDEKELNLRIRKPLTFIISSKRIKKLIQLIQKQEM
ncbi:trypsin-like peptidase domain-containing protein [Bacillus velezensis]|uniref:trypsin-like peptidase domain-containing protein n=1 Tax=Bacillus velezensis TaxID=492670 RepID=UPI001F0EFFA0|nr:trypsin-like peptidase domain-containing protein [Bacillus velezensis]UMQ50314.1 trypsin-like peptidase domain-containing protein [Bacillus velezensis]